MAQNRFYSSTYLPTTLAAAITSPTATTISVNSITNAPATLPYTLLLDWGLPTQEAVSVTASAGSGPFTLTVTRGIDGTTAQTHVNGATVVHGVTAEDYNEPQVHMATGTSTGAYPGVIHGLQNGSSVVGTTDAQTLTNKTLGATSYTGNITMSQSSATGGLESITNTHATPTNPNVQWIAAGVADLVLGISVSGDTVPRYEINSSGKIQWGAGGASAVDTDLYRSAAATLQTDGAFTIGTQLSAATGAYTASTATGPVVTITNNTGAPTNPNETIFSNSATDKAFGLKVIGDTQARLGVLASGSMNWGPGGATVSDTNLYRNAVGEAKTDNSLTVNSNLTVGGAQLLAGGSGVLGINNAGTAPTTTPATGAVVYGKSGFVKWRGGDGADYNTGSFISTLTANTVGFANTVLTTIGSFSTPLGVGTYLVVLFVPYLPTGTIGSTSTFALSFTGTATGASFGNFTVHNTSPQLTQNATPNASFVSPTHTAFNTLVQINATFIVTIAGTLTGQASVQTAADTMTIFAGSYMEVQPVA